jgi:hypothetical protein
MYNSDMLDEPGSPAPIRRGRDIALFRTEAPSAHNSTDARRGVVHVQLARLR